MIVLSICNVIVLLILHVLFYVLSHQSHVFEFLIIALKIKKKTICLNKNEAKFQLQMQMRFITNHTTYYKILQLRFVGSTTGLRLKTCAFGEYNIPFCFRGSM